MANESGFQVGRDAPHFYETHTARFMAPFVDSLVSACVGSGDAVLDVACGTGFAARAAAAAAGDGARIEGTDINPAMIAQASAIAQDTGVDIHWREASALDLPYDDREFDAVICQQGIQFFPEPTAAIREMARVLRLGGRLGLTAWAPAQGVSFLHLEADMLARVLGEPMPPFSIGEEQLAGWLADAGLANASIELVEVAVDLPPVQDYVPEHLKALPWSASFFGQSDEVQRAALRELEEDLKHLKSGEGLTAPFRSYLATAIV